jgi:Pectate lyase superfamily protein
MSIDAKMYKRVVFLFLMVAADGGCSLPGEAPEAKSSTGQGVSRLWGWSGELWSAHSRLPDYSFAGYRSGRRALPDIPLVANVKDFGAAGDNIKDDTAAFESALASVRAGAILVPHGRYRITRPLTLDKSGVVLRGEDRDETVLIAGTVPGNCSTANQGPPNCAPYHGAAMLQIVGKVDGGKLANVVAPAKRGERTLEVSSTRSIGAGQFVRLRMKNPADNSLGCHLYADAGCLNAERRRWHAGHIVDWVVAVESVDGKRITLVRPLRLDVRNDWSPEIWSFDASVQESGIENMTVRFSGVPYAGHNREQGHYAIFLKDAYNCWIRNVTIVDADRGIEVGGGYNTISGIILRADVRAPQQTANTYATGHFGLSVGRPRAQDNLFVDSRLETVFVHNLSVASFANGNVFSRITSQAPHFDHHGGAPYDNLYTEITLTRTAEDLFKSGGNRPDEPNGTRTTLWNLRYQGALDIGKSEDKLPGLNIIGVDGLTSRAPEQSSANWWVESWPSAVPRPPNLYEAQLERRQ